MTKNRCLVFLSFLLLISTIIPPNLWGEYQDSPELSSGMEIEEGYTVFSQVDFVQDENHFRIVGVGEEEQLRGFKTFERMDIYLVENGSLKLLNSHIIETEDFGPIATSIRTEDINGDGKGEIIVDTYTGGNDVIASAGLYIYEFNTDGTLTELFGTPFGAPTIDDVDGDGVSEVITYNEYWPIVFAHVEVFTFPEEIYTFDGNKYEISVETFPEFYEEYKEDAYEYYQGLKSGKIGEDATFGEGHNMLSAVAMYLIACLKSDDVESVERFWQDERDYLNDALDEELFTTIKSDFYTDEGRERFK